MRASTVTEVYEAPGWKEGRRDEDFSLQTAHHDRQKVSAQPYARPSHWKAIVLQTRLVTFCSLFLTL